jgi:hypothetical protein
LTVSIVQHWLKDRSLKRQAHMLCHQTYLVERYINWLQDRGAIAANPFAELHRQYGPCTAPIVRALIDEDSDAALQQLRRLPRFGSFLGRVMEEHVAHMRALGYRYDTNEGILRRFDRYLQHNPELAEVPLNKLVERWSEEQPSPSHLFEAQKAGRMVSKAMHRVDPRVPILPIGEGVARAACQGNRSPHLYTDAEIQRVLSGGGNHTKENRRAKERVFAWAVAQLKRRLGNFPVRIGHDGFD